MTRANALRVERSPALIRSQVLENLRQAILDRRLAPGQRLIERELVELTGVSRTSVREALRELAAEGLVTAIPNRGTVVTMRQRRGGPAALPGALGAGGAGRPAVRRATRARPSARRSPARWNGSSSWPRRAQPILAAKDAFYDVLFDRGRQRGAEVGRRQPARAGERAAVAVADGPGPPEHSLAELRAIVDAVDAGDAERRRGRLRPARRGGRPGRSARALPAGQGLTYFHRLYDRRTLSLPIGRDRSGP